MNEAAASAPGKLLLVGEYAVLGGAPALVAAVDRRARVRVRHGSEDAGRISCVPLGVSAESFRVRDGRLVLTECSGVELGLTARLVPRILEQLGQTADQAEEYEIEIDSGALFERADDGRTVKLGLGSSAAVSAALIEAFEALAGFAVLDPEPRLRRWLPVYRDALGGRASGADLAASLAGGLIEFADPPGSGPHLAAREWPAELAWLPIWVGRPAVTTDFVAAFDRWCRSAGAAAQQAIAGLSDLSARACGALGRPAAFLEAVAEFAEALDAIGRQAGIEIVSAPHRELARLAAESGVVYKSCGAGGGDLGVALSEDPERLGAFGRQVSRSGALPLHLAVAESGAGFCADWEPATPRA